jgi:hypothetical protein
VEVFIAVIVVLVLVNAFFVFVMRGIVTRIARFARQNTLRQASVFEELLIHKEQTLEGLKVEIETAAARLNTSEHGEKVSAKELIGSKSGDIPVKVNFAALTQGKYKNKNFTDEYRVIRENFVFDQEARLREILGRVSAKPTGNVQAAEQILSDIDMDTCFQLSTLASDEQINVLREVFSGEQFKLLEEYLEDKETFECHEFLGWLKQYVFTKSEQIVVRTGYAADVSLNKVDGRVATEYDNGLCEGMYVLSQGKMYDYSIRNKEIVG